MLQTRLTLQLTTYNLQPPSFNLRSSTFDLRPSTFNLQPSTFNFQFLTSNTNSKLPASNSKLPASNFQLPTSSFLPNSTACTSRLFVVDTQFENRPPDHPPTYLSNRTYLYHDYLLTFSTYLVYCLPDCAYAYEYDASLIHDDPLDDPLDCPLNCPLDYPLHCPLDHHRHTHFEGR